MYQDTSEFASGEDRTAGNGSVSDDRSYTQHFGGEDVHSHNRVVSGEETMLSPGTFLSKEIQEESKDASQKFTYEQLQGY